MTLGGSETILLFLKASEKNRPHGAEPHLRSARERLLPTLPWLPPQPGDRALPVVTLAAGLAVGVQGLGVAWASGDIWASDTFTGASAWLQPRRGTRVMSQRRGVPRAAVGAGRGGREAGSPDSVSSNWVEVVQCVGSVLSPPRRGLGQPWAPTEPSCSQPGCISGSWAPRVGWWMVKVQLATCSPRQKGPAHPQLPLGRGHPLVAHFWGPGLASSRPWWQPCPCRGGSKPCIQDST